ncbi:ankyrin repeat domain-containing protein 40 [Egretta garzetta]|nr:ankyrin repeat domain-containing protein 40 [Egretta garzetta]
MPRDLGFSLLRSAKGRIFPFERCPAPKNLGRTCSASGGRREAQPGRLSTTSEGWAVRLAERAGFFGTVRRTSEHQSKGKGCAGHMLRKHMRTSRGRFGLKRIIIKGGHPPSHPPSTCHSLFCLLETSSEVACVHRHGPSRQQWRIAVYAVARTCLHWACKRNHAQVVSCLLDAGADKHILTAKGELAAELTSKPDIRKILGEEETECQGVKDLNLPIVANYLANPPFPYVYTEEGIPDGLAESQNESASTSSASQCETSPCSSATQVESICTPTSCNSEDDFPALDTAEQLPTPSAAITAAEHTEPEVPNGPACRPSPPRSRGLFSPVASTQAAPLQTDSSPTGPAPAFQPFFFTGTFPYSMQELVLKVRVQNLRDNDFIEIELDRQELTYQDLLRVSCCELGVNPEQVEKIRKLPNTLVRKDKDVARLQDFQELELVLVKADSSPFRNTASTLTERPCYNSRASKLTY